MGQSETHKIVSFQLPSRHWRAVLHLAKTLYYGENGAVFVVEQFMRAAADLEQGPLAGRKYVYKRGRPKGVTMPRGSQHSFYVEREALIVLERTAASWGTSRGEILRRVIDQFLDTTPEVKRLIDLHYVEMTHDELEETHGYRLAR